MMDEKFPFEIYFFPPSGFKRMLSTESMRTCQVIPTPIAENEEKEKESK